MDCICKNCARDVNCMYFTPGEVDSICYNCDDCVSGTNSGWKDSCDNYKEPIKLAEHRAEMRRRKLEIIHIDTTEG